jgi:hypothetical protein
MWLSKSRWIVGENNRAFFPAFLLPIEHFWQAAATNLNPVKLLFDIQYKKTIGLDKTFSSHINESANLNLYVTSC